MPDEMLILEGIVTTQNADGGTNISPMGPLVDAGMQRLVFRPYQTSRTFANLKRAGQGVLHVTDDVEMLARAAVGDLDPLPPLFPAAVVEGQVLAGACRWYEFRVTSLDDSQPRTRVEARVVHSGRLRDFFGFHRARHAVVEAAILATRTAFLPEAEVVAELKRLTPLIEKTGGSAERRAFEFLQAHIERAYDRKKKSPPGPDGPEGGKLP